MLRTALKKLLKRVSDYSAFPHLEEKTFEVSEITSLREALGWDKTPVLDEDLYKFRVIEDLNQRLRRDAEVIASVCRNLNPRRILEIGTAHGHTTALMARNAPDAEILTVNIPPGEIEAGGILTTYALPLEEIGSYYKEKGCSNVRQILANTANWTPDAGDIDIAFIDGCHDTEFVIADTLKVLSRCKPGSVLMWHDFSLPMRKNYYHIHTVCLGIEELYERKAISKPIYHLRDSWVGLYVV